MRKFKALGTNSKNTFIYISIYTYESTNQHHGNGIGILLAELGGSKVTGLTSPVAVTPVLNLTGAIVPEATVQLFNFAIVPAVILPVKSHRGCVCTRMVAPL